MSRPVLHLLCGKIASGKSTLAATLTHAHQAIRLSEDHWLASLYAGEMNSVADYVRNAGRIRAVLGPLVVDLLKAGNNVVLDFPANTVANRQWLASLAIEAGVEHQLHYLAVDDATCLARLQARNAAGEHDFAATEAQFELITRHFQAPHEQEGLRVIEY